MSLQPSASLLGLVDASEEEIVKPFVVGTITVPLPEHEKTESKTHRWTVYLRGLQNEDLSYFINYVVFKLHYSFENPDRKVTSPPFEVTEQGWGEFDIIIDVHFRDYSKSVEVNKFLHFFHSDPSIPPSVPVVHEIYDEFVFIEPHDKLKMNLDAGPTKFIENHPRQEYFNTLKLAQDEEKFLLKLLTSYQRVLYDIHQCKQRIDEANEGITRAKAELRAIQQQSNAAAMAGGSSSSGAKGKVSLKTTVKREKTS
eukprot:TRINITY_DN4122_c0_g1_i1.p1 TRINITY_DN4122_c0_g1~~TRINITY_DN4122_c0_g1_i1.p1  ORF type:complete len:255 (+),score=69.93 TRINITY_DN4122_c0_g1_i1:871-1635(+)